MDFKDHLNQGEKGYTIYNINKESISHLPYSLRVLFENYVRNNGKESSPEVIKKLREDLLLDTKVEDLIKVYDRTKHGQLIKGMAKLETMKVANEATRKGLPKDTDAAKKIVADLRAGESDFAASTRMTQKKRMDKYNILLDERRNYYM